MTNALITIRTLLPGETEFMELISAGTVRRQDHQIIISYRESELTGMDDTQTTITMDKEDVTIHREGSFMSTLEFSLGGPRPCLYQTPYGTLRVTTLTREYRMVDELEKTELFLMYGLVIEGENQGNTRIEILIRPKADSR